MRLVLLVVLAIATFNVSRAVAACDPDCISDPPVKAGKGGTGIKTFRK
jgi:hypothetical protein